MSGLGRYGRTNFSEVLHTGSAISGCQRRRPATTRLSENIRFIGVFHGVLLRPENPYPPRAPRVSGYCSPNVSLDIFDEYAERFDISIGAALRRCKEFIISGDFNGKSKAWSGTKTDRRGRMLSEVLDGTTLLLLGSVRAPRFRDVLGGVFSSTLWALVVASLSSINVLWFWGSSSGLSGRPAIVELSLRLSLPVGQIWQSRQFENHCICGRPSYRRVKNTEQVIRMSRFFIFTQFVQ